jgi:bifunctional lysine-specific demethylase and histidyl-hydroxylase NO66
VPPDPVGAGPAGDALRRLVGDLDRFADQHWGRAPLLRRGTWPGTPPLSIDDVDRLVTSSGLRWPAFRLVRDGASLPVASFTRPARIGGQRVTDLVDGPRALEAFDRGATAVLQGLHRYHPPVAELCAQLEAALGHPVQANAYLTPPGSRGLDVHHDTHDVLALQTHGHKHWVVHEPALAAPLPSQPWSSDEHRPGPLVLDVDLAPGDLLYLPRGAPHAAETVGEVSLHLTIGIRAVTWYDVVRRAADRLADDPGVRESLPIGYPADPDALAAETARRLRRAADSLTHVAPADLVEDLLGDRRRQQRPGARGRLHELIGLDKLDDDTRVRCREGLLPALVPAGDRVQIRLPDRDVRLPAAARPVLTELLDGHEHRVGDLAERLDEESRTVLVRRLVREGVLETRGAARG